jgi:hypothetical protein
MFVFRPFFAVFSRRCKLAAASAGSVPPAAQRMDSCSPAAATRACARRLLQAYEELRIPVDAMPERAWGLWSAVSMLGQVPAEIDTLMRGIDWRAAFATGGGNTLTSRKQDDREFLVRFRSDPERQFFACRVTDPGQRSTRRFRLETLRSPQSMISTSCRRISRCAADLETARVVLERGDMASRCGASMSAPGVRAVEVDGRLWGRRIVENLSTMCEVDGVSIS